MPSADRPTAGATQAYEFTSGNLTHNGDLLAQGLASFTLTYLDAGGSAVSAIADLRLIEVDLVTQSAGVTYPYHLTISPRALTP